MANNDPTPTVQQSSSRVTYTCGCSASGDLVASYCPMHGDPIRTVHKPQPRPSPADGRQGEMLERLLTDYSDKLIVWAVAPKAARRDYREAKDTARQALRSHVATLTAERDSLAVENRLYRSGSTELLDRTAAAEAEVARLTANLKTRAELHLTDLETIRRLTAELDRWHGEADSLEEFLAQEKESHGQTLAANVRLTAEVERLVTEKQDEVYLRGNQLAAISSILMADTPVSLAATRIPADHILYTVAFQDALRTVEKVIAMRAANERLTADLAAARAEGERLRTKLNHYSMNPGLADHYRGLAKAAVKALGLEDFDNAPVDITNEIVKMATTLATERAARVQAERERGELRAACTRLLETMEMQEKRAD